MITIGELLANARLKRKLTIEQVEKAIRIRAKFLVAIEKNEFDKLPPGTFIKGFIRNYAVYLGISPDEAIAFYRRQSNEKPVDVLPLKNQKRFLKRFSLTPQLFTTTAIVILVAIFFGYLIFSYFSFSGSPYLQLDEPKNNLVVRSSEINFTGTGASDAEIKINGQPVIVDQKGKFKVTIQLQPGINTITISATNKFGKETKIIRNLRLEQ